MVHPTTGLLTPAEVQALFEPPSVNGATSPPTPRVLGQSD
jgi:hypothetical protein